jgi:hypothetical protein
MTATRAAYSGVRGMRLQFLRDNAPDALRELESKGELDGYMEDFGERFGRRLHENFEGCLASCGVTEDIKGSDPGEWDRRVGRARRMAEELTIHDMVEAL